MSNLSRLACCCVLFYLTSNAAALDSEPANQPNHAEGVRFFETKVRPVLAQYCYECHAAEEQESELRVDTLAGLLRGGHAGPSLVPGKPAGSLLVTAIGYRDNDLRMPPDQKLSDAEIADITRWVEIGAPHPDSDSVQPLQTGSQIDLQAGRQHWAFQPPHKPTPPTIDAGVVDPIDAFVLARLQAAGLHRAPPADKATLLRRASFDLTGLPPTPGEIDAFLADESDDAFANVVDRLLASPHYGERWGRHWLDVARYADSNGLDENVVHAHAWRYRDYVVQSLNEDKPYSDFIVEQLAGDLLDSGDDIPLRNERLIATGFLVLGPKVLAEKDEAKMEMDIIDEQLDTLGRSIMGLTLGCARCHTHKFDPISHHDYYALAGIFKSTRTMDSYKTVAEWHENVVETAEQKAAFEQHQQRLADKQQQIDQAIAAATAALETNDEKWEPAEREKHYPADTQAALKTLREERKQLQDSAPQRPMAMGVVDGTVADTAVHLRGSHLTLGDVVPRRFPEVLTPEPLPPLPEDRSGRLEFARWLTDGQHPLTARVMVNRIWRGHFGKGLVGTVDNFGLQGDQPTHPQLLDWLAVRFVEQGWSIKAMHRMIMLSDTYQASSRYDAHNAAQDPDNRLYWRYDLRRLEAEAIRDGLLAISGQLDPSLGGSLLQLKSREYVFNHTSQDRSTYGIHRRSIYVPVIRNHLYDMFKLFDYTDASVLTGDRNTSTLAPQALFLMNSPWIDEITTAMAERLHRREGTLETRIERLYRQAYGRRPTTDEVSTARQFLDRFEKVLEPQANVEPAGDRQQLAWQALCQAVISSSEFVYLR